MYVVLRAPGVLAPLLVPVSFQTLFRGFWLSIELPPTAQSCCKYGEASGGTKLPAQTEMEVS